ncbi:MAG: FAD-dependent oxidoreductase [bacterium]|nr:FAD-dependent oxidoreductase [bacterium]
MKDYEVIIIGAGPAGLLAAMECKKQGLKNLLVIEKNVVIGGMLNSADYKVFRNSDKTGKEYSKELIKEFEASGIETKLNTMVLNISPEGKVICTNSEHGVQALQARKILIANGGKEKGRAPLNMAGDRVSGTYSLATAKMIVSEPDLCLGKTIAIYGTEHLDTIESLFISKGIKVSVIINPKNNAFSFTPASDALIYNGYDIKEIRGEGRLERLVLQKDFETVDVRCDTLLFASGWLSDGIVPMRSGIVLNPETTGAKVDKNYQTSRSDIFASGNGIYIHEAMEDIIEEAVKVAAAIKASF